MRNPDVRAARVALIADAIVNGDVPGADEAVAALVAAGWGFLVLPDHDEAFASTPTRLEYLVDDAVDYRKHGYEVVVVAAPQLPGGGVWDEWLATDLIRRGEEPFRFVDLADVASLT